MKHLGRFKPEPLPPTRHIWLLAGSLVLLVLGCIMMLDHFHAQGVIGKDLYEAIILLIIGISAGTLIGFVHERCVGVALLRSRDLGPIYSAVPSHILLAGEARDRCTSRRIAEVCLVLVGRSLSDQMFARPITLRLQATELASLARTTVKEVNRTLAEWEGKGIITLNEDSVTVRDAAALTKFAGGDNR